MKTKYIFASTLAAVAMTACTDLDVDVKSYYEQYPNNEIAVEAKASGAFFAFRGALGRRFDEAISMLTT